VHPLDGWPRYRARSSTPIPLQPPGHRRSPSTAG
jgi:hypothetical protein